MNIMLAKYTDLTTFDKEISEYTANSLWGPVLWNLPCTKCYVFIQNQTIVIKPKHLKAKKYQTPNIYMEYSEISLYSLH